MEKPTNGEYGVALYNALKSSGLSDSDALIVAEAAKMQREQYNLMDDVEVPRIPGRLNIK